MQRALFSVLFPAYAKAHRGRLSYASGGNGTVAHLGMELFKHMAGVDIVHVPYKGTAAVVQALVTGEVQTSFAQMATVRPQIPSGKLRVLAVATATRAQAMPDLPTVAEAGVPEFKADVWFGVVAPDVEEQFRRQGIEPMTSTPGEFAAFLRSDVRKLNPAALVPALVDGGQVLTESRIINEYLEGAYARVRARWRKAATDGISAGDLKPSIARLSDMVERMDRAAHRFLGGRGDEAKPVIDLIVNICYY